MKAILKLIDDLRKVMAEQFVQMENETVVLKGTYSWGIMNDSLLHMERACAVLEIAASVRVRAASTTLEERLLYAAVVLHRKPYPTEGP